MSYLSSIRSQPKMAAYDDLINGRDIQVQDTKKLHEIDIIYFGILKAIQENRANEFQIHYTKKKRSIPIDVLTSPFINDSFLIFCLIVGIKKFDLDIDWMEKVLAIRSKNEITTTFENILKDDLNSKSNLAEITIIFQHLMSTSENSDDLQISAYQSVTQNFNLFGSKDDFHIISSLRAFDLAIEQRKPIDNNRINALNVFEKKFIKRTKVAASIFRTTIFLCVIFVLQKILSENPGIGDWIDEHNTLLAILSLIGVTVLGNIFPFINGISNEWTMKLFGYPKDLIKK